MRYFDCDKVKTMETVKTIHLTQTVQKGGCAAKVAAVELRKILSQVRMPKAPPELIVGTGTFDDAAIYRVNADVALVQTLDFFTPIVDSPRLFGKIAAANALSDVYAMGGKPATAMAIFAFPLALMEDAIAVEVLQGAAEVIEASGAALVGGHTIDDDTMKFGLSITGFVHPEKVWTNAGARPGDALILTKGLGTGTLTAALKREEATEADIDVGLQSMCQLNDIAGVVSDELLSSIHAATDVTGFGLAGHAFNLARSSQVSLEIEFKALPVLPRALEFLEKEFLTKAHRTNAEYVKTHTRFTDASKVMEQLVYDPQTSGGLLLSVDPSCADELLRALKTRFPMASRIGRAKSPDARALHFQ